MTWKRLIGFLAGVAVASVAFAQSQNNVLSQLGVKGVTDQIYGTNPALYAGYLVKTGTNGLFSTSMMSTDIVPRRWFETVFLDSVNGLNATNSGTATCPYKTFAYAAARTTNDTAFVFAPGTYAGDTITNSHVHHVALIGLDPTNTTMTGILNFNANLMAGTQDISVDLYGINVDTVRQYQYGLFNVGLYNRAKVTSQITRLSTNLNSSLTLFMDPSTYLASPITTSNATIVIKAYVPQGTAAGQLTCWDGANWAIVAAGTTNQVLYGGTVPFWGSASIVYTNTAIPGDFTPAISNSYSIGSQTMPWSNGWFATGLYVGGSNVLNSIYVGNYASNWISVYGSALASTNYVNASISNITLATVVANGSNAFSSVVVDGIRTPDDAPYVALAVGVTNRTLNYQGTEVVNWSLGGVNNGWLMKRPLRSDSDGAPSFDPNERALMGAWIASNNLTVCDSLFVSNNISEAGTNLVLKYASVLEPLAVAASNHAFYASEAGHSTNADNAMQLNSIGASAFARRDTTNTFTQPQTISINSAATIVSDATNSNSSGGALYHIAGDTGEYLQLGVFGSAFALPGVRQQGFIGCSTNIIIGLDMDVASGGTSVFDVYTGGYLAVTPTLRVSGTNIMENGVALGNKYAPKNIETLQTVTTRGNTSDQDLALSGSKIIVGGLIGGPGGQTTWGLGAWGADFGVLNPYGIQNLDAKATWNFGYCNGFPPNIYAAQTNQGYGSLNLGYINCAVSSAAQLMTGRGSLNVGNLANGEYQNTSGNGALNVGANNTLTHDYSAVFGNGQVSYETNSVSARKYYEAGAALSNRYAGIAIEGWTNNWNIGAAEGNYASNWVYTWGPALATTNYVNASISNVTLATVVAAGSNASAVITAYGVRNENESPMLVPSVCVSNRTLNVGGVPYLKWDSNWLYFLQPIRSNADGGESMEANDRVLWGNWVATNDFAVAGTITEGSQTLSQKYDSKIRPVEVKTDNYNVLTNDVAKTFVMNTASKTNFLPSVDASNVGIWYTFVKHNTGTLTIKAAGITQIADSGQGDTIYDSQAAEVYATVTLQLVTSTNWVITGAHGTWTTTD